MLHSIYQQIWKTQQWPQDWKMLIFIPILKKGNAKECSNYCTIVLISHASKVMPKILQARLQQYMNWELPDVKYKLGLEKAEEPEIKLPTFVWSGRNEKNSRKTSTFASLTTIKPLIVWIVTNCGKILKEMGVPDSWETCMWVKKQQLALNMKQWTGSKLGKKYNKAVHCHPAYLTYM